VLTKPPAVLAGLFFLGRRRWAALGIAAAVVLVTCAVFVLRMGLGGLATETSAWRELVERSTLEWVTGPNPQGLPTLVLDAAGWFSLRPTAAGLMLSQLLAVLVFAALVLAFREERGGAFRMTCLAIALCSPLAWRANFVLALPSVRRQVAAAREGHRLSAVLLGGVIVLSVLTSGVFLDRTATERILSFRPWGFLGLLLVGVEFSARAAGRSVRAGTPPG
jgi:hypothetical protein